MSPKDTASSGKRSGGDGPFTPGRIAMILLAVLVLVFVFENTREVKIRLLIPEVTMPLYLALGGVAVIGAACGAYFMSRRNRRR
ncbi:LapA family protein [Streptomyces beihaiensis]|uniref:LapA family protein n=1 Tax=Streptomyces beihaiensis TaxID=2984495 RepID=A0ABT3U213_9ACTN|nr:LapA family protein [Streptomyces beihaiensis]MCX3063353.1 LapA family protein [Streptomyces beihaiensis]